MALTREVMVDRMLRSDAAYDGRFITGVLTTGIYCLPSCRARKPKSENVDFFTRPEDAEAAGLRACKRCRPDLFYRDQDPDRSLVGELVGELRDDPSIVRNVAELVGRSGAGSSKLHELFRRHFHATPAEVLSRIRIERVREKLLTSHRSVADVAFEVGFETLSAFNERFHASTRMTPQRYRKLRSATSFEIELPSWFDNARVLSYLGRDPESLTERVDGRTFSFATRPTEDGEGTATAVSVELDGRRARCRLETSVRTAGLGARVHDAVLRYLGLTMDPRPFARRLRGSPELGTLLEGRRGLTISQTRDVDDALIWVVVGQQVSLPVAFAMRRRLTGRAGVRVRDGLYAPPALSAVAELGIRDLRGAAFSQRKAEYLLDIARDSVSGRLDLRELVTRTATEIERRLLAVRGLGPWSVNYLMMRALSLGDCVPVGDVALARSLQSFFNLAQRPRNEDILDLMKPFAPYRSLATFYLWDRLGDAQ